MRGTPAKRGNLWQVRRSRDKQRRGGAVPPELLPQGWLLFPRYLLSRVASTYSDNSIRIYGGTPWQESPRESSRRSTCVLCSRSRHQSPPSPRNAWHRSTNYHPPTWRNTYRPFQRLASQKRCLAELADTVSRETRDRSLSWTLSTQSSLTNRGFVAPRFANAVRPHSRQACTHRHAILPPRYGRLSEPGRITLTR